MVRKRAQVISLVVIALTIVAGGYFMFSSRWQENLPARIPPTLIDISLNLDLLAAAAKDEDLPSDMHIVSDVNSDSAIIPFAQFDLNQPRLVTFTVGNGYMAQLTTREQNEQLLDWLLFALATEAGLSIETLNQSLFDLMPIRETYIRPIASFEYGVTRSFYAGEGQVIVLIPETTSQEQADLLAEVADHHYKNTGMKPAQLMPFSYRLDRPGRTATIIRLAPIPSEELFSSAFGYHEQSVQSETELADFLNSVDDLSLVQLTEDGLLLGGRRLLSRNYSGVQLEDVAALWQAYERSGIRGVGFSLDPTYDYAGLSQQFMRWRPQLEAIASRSGATISLSDVDELQADLNATLRLLATVDTREAGLFRLISQLKQSTSFEAQALAEQIEKAMWEDYRYQTARYEGFIQGTAVGMTLFYTDLLAKLWALDYWGAAPTHIDGFVPLTQQRLPSIYYQEALELPNTRLWFGPQTNGFQSINTSDQHTLLFSRTATSVFAASSSDYRPEEGEVVAATGSALFLDWMNDHYEEIARYEPQYQRLNQIMKWSLLLSWLSQQQQLSQLAFVDHIEFEQDYWFPQWLQTQQNLSFNRWSGVVFFERGYLGTQTEAMPILFSQQYTTFPEDIRQDEVWTLSGGVSLPDPEIFHTNQTLDMDVNPRLRRAFIEYDSVNEHNLIRTVTDIEYRLDTLPDGSAQVTAQERQVSQHEAARPRTLHGELATGQLFGRTIRRNGEVWRMDTYIGEAPFQSLLLMPTLEGIAVTVSSRDADLGRQLALDYSRGDTLTQLMASYPQVQTVIPLLGEQGFLLQFERSSNWMYIAPAEERSIGVPEPWQMLVADEVSGQRNVLVRWHNTAVTLQGMGGYLVRDPNNPRLVTHLTEIPIGLTPITVIAGDSGSATIHLDRQTGILYYQLTDLSGDLQINPEQLLNLLQEYDMARLERQLANDPNALVYIIPVNPYQGRTEQEVTRSILDDPEATKAAEQIFLDYEAEAISHLFAFGQYEDALQHVEQLWLEPNLRNHLWTDLAVQDNNTVAVSRFALDETPFVWVVGEQQTSSLTEDEIVARSPEGNLLLLKGDTAVDSLSRLEVIGNSNEDVTFIYFFEIAGTVYVQAGRDMIALPKVDSLFELDEIVLAEESTADEAVLAPLRNLESSHLILFSGQGFESSEQGESHRMENLMRTRGLTQYLIANDMKNIYADDNPEEARNNLAAQTPLVNERGEWDLTLLIDAPSFANTEAEQELALIEAAAARAGIPTSRQMITPTRTANVAIITARDDSSILEDLGNAGTLSGKHVTYFVLDRAQADRSYTRAAITEYDAVGIMVNEGSQAFSLSNMEILFENMFAHPQEIQGDLPSVAFIKAIDTVSEQENVDIETKMQLRRFRNSFVPSLSQNIDWGGYI